MILIEVTGCVCVNPTASKNNAGTVGNVTHRYNDCRSLTADQHHMDTHILTHPIKTHSLNKPKPVDNCCLIQTHTRNLHTLYVTHTALKFNFM